MDEFDVAVIGCGPAGQKAAIKCAKAGRRVALVDERQVVGGHCLHIGTIPSKTLRMAIINLSGYYERNIYGASYRANTELNINDLLYRVHTISEREIKVIHNQLARNHVEVFTGAGSFLDPHTIRVASNATSEDISAKYVVVCTGGVSKILTPLPFNGVNVLNTDDILSMSFLPKRMMVIGGGVIGLEYASMFSLLDIEVQVVSRYTEVLPWIDHLLVESLKAHMLRHGAQFHLDARIKDISVEGPRNVTGTLTNGTSFDVELVMYAAPRKGNTAELNLVAAGLEAGENDYLDVNGNYQTAVSHVYAAGDVIGWPSLASTSIDQGRKAANHLLGVPDVPYNPLFPIGIYTFPDISMVGASEEELKKKGTAYEVGVGQYCETARGQIIGDVDGLVKLLFDPNDLSLLGVHIIGSEATELIHIGQAVMVNGGKISYFIDNVFNYPTLAEVYKIAALNGFNKTKAALPTDHL